MVDVVLINPIDRTQLRRRLGLKAPPLNLLYLASFLEKVGRSVKVIDDNLHEMGAKKVAELVSKHNPLVVGITAATATVKTALKYIHEIKRLLPNTLTVIGGPHVSFMAVETLNECPALDAVVIGEGEETLAEVVDRWERGREIDVRGVVYRKGGRVKVNPPRPFLKNLDEIPFPARHLVPFESYKLMGNPIGSMITSRGCPYSCEFCSSSLLMGRMFRRRSAANVAEEMEELVHKYKVRKIEFLDDVFMLNKKRAVAIAKEIRERGLDVSFVASSRVDGVDLEVLKELQKAGLSTIYYGAESGSQRILDLMGKGITLEQTKDAVKKSKAAGIKTIASFILGYPGETLEEIDQTIKFATQLDIDYAQFSILTPYPGTPIFYKLKEKGLLETEDWDRYTVLEPVIKYEKLGLSKELVAKKLAEAYYKFYLRPKYLFKHLYMIRVLISTLLRSYVVPKLTGGESKWWYRDLGE